MGVLARLLQIVKQLVLGTEAAVELKVIHEIALAVLPQVLEPNVRGVGGPLEVKQAALDALNFLPVISCVQHAPHCHVVVALHQNVSVAVQRGLVQVFAQLIVPLLDLLLDPGLLGNLLVEGVRLGHGLRGRDLPRVLRLLRLPVPLERFQFFIGVLLIVVLVRWGHGGFLFLLDWLFFDKG